jgi:acyl-CoA dehydrogenase
VAAEDPYLSDPSIWSLAQFFDAKSLATLKQEDRTATWYADWLDHQAQHRIYASVLAPSQYSAMAFRFDLLRYARFLEVFAYFSPAHGYSLQVTSLGLFAILMGDQPALKREAVAALEQGGLLAFAVSEKAHGSDLLATDFSVAGAGPGRLIANGTKYYIGNSNVAALVAILAKRRDARSDEGSRQAPLALIALRPAAAPGFRNLGRIHTLGVRAGYVGEFAVTGHELPDTDVIAEGRRAWDAVLGSVTLGKFFLGFGSIGICEHAFHEAADHLRGRILYGRPVIALPHIRAAMCQAYARIAAMKLYAYRALDYLHSATAHDRRYLLLCAVQKAKVSTEGVKTMTLLSECAGARGFEADTYLEMALRDAQLIPGLEGSAHINLGLTARFCARYFARRGPHPAPPASRLNGEAASGENPYLMEARTGGVGTVAFPPCLEAYRPLRHIASVRLFRRQVSRVRLFLSVARAMRANMGDTQCALALGQCLATIVYGQLIAENAARLGAPAPLVSVIFHLLASDLSAAALAFASLPRPTALQRHLLRRVVAVTHCSMADWDGIATLMERP